MLIVLVIALLVLGPKRLPEMARGLGKGIRDFRRSIESGHDDPAPATPAAP
ncbi:MAG: twin-arginine translocase TatA/TatE family subunit, partial [Actinomycetota bacterium]